MVFFVVKYKQPEEFKLCFFPRQIAQSLFPGVGGRRRSSVERRRADDCHYDLERSHLALLANDFFPSDFQIHTFPVRQ
jgi:hypothetical protein